LNNSCEGDSVCTREYKPVCGEITVRMNADCPTGMFCTQYQSVSKNIQKTFSNKCELEKAGAKFLYEGKCKSDVGDKILPNCKS
jgi:hypothetical protein